MDDFKLHWLTCTAWILISYNNPPQQRNFPYIFFGRAVLCDKLWRRKSGCWFILLTYTYCLIVPVPVPTIIPPKQHCSSKKMWRNRTSGYGWGNLIAKKTKHVCTTTLCGGKYCDPKHNVNPDRCHSLSLLCIHARTYFCLWILLWNSLSLDVVTV